MNDIRKQKRWVLWNLEEVEGRQTKVPYSVQGKRASSTDPSTWTDYATAKRANEMFGSGIGIVFTPAEDLLGIDIDHVLEDGKLAGEHIDSIHKLIKEAKTYTEISPSGTGLHLYLSLSAPLTLTASRHSPFEAYTSGRYFTYTEKSYGKKKPIRTVTPDEALQLLEIIGYPWGKTEDTQSDTLGTSSSFTDEELLEKMFRSKNGPAIKSLYEGDLSAYHDDHSRADAAFLNHLAFWSGKDEQQIERVWLASPLGSRKKTQDPKNRKNYVLRSIAGAVKNCKEVYKPQGSDDGSFIDFLFTVGANGNKSYTKNTENMCRILREHPKFTGRFRFDEFTQTFELKDGETWRSFEDSDGIDVQTEIQILYPFFRTVGKDMVYDAIIKVSKEQKIDSANDHLRSIVWDKEARLDTWLTNTYGAPDDAYHQAVASNWLKGMVKRIVFPGCKFDYVLVLEGAQGAKKSTSLHILGSVGKRSWHVETTMSTDTKDFFMQFAGKSIIEFSEGETLSRTEVKKMKAIITMQSDKFRPPYGRVSVDFPRRCVFAMTTNQEQYLKDETGNRRWLPVRVTLPEADIDWLQANRDQLLAEAYHRVVVLTESVHEFPKEETKAQQDSRRISDPNEDRIAEWYYTDQFLSDQIKYNDGITVQMVYQHALNGFGSLKKFEEMAITDVLANSLKLVKKRKMVNGVQGIRWFPPESPYITGEIGTLPVQFKAQDHGFEEDELPDL
jgi:predicted P-loop ATPase